MTTIKLQLDPELVEAEATCTVGTAGSRSGKRVVLYVDDRTDLGREALRLLKGASIVTIPVDGGLPFAVRGRSRYDGLDEIKLLAAELREHG